MRLLIDRVAIRRAKLINAIAGPGPTRRYYEIGKALLRLDDNLTIEHVANHVVDAQAGWDITQPGFTLDEARIGHKRTKITIRRILHTSRYDRTLTQQLDQQEVKQ